jgi:hypothetical protein
MFTFLLLDRLVEPQVAMAAAEEALDELTSTPACIENRVGQSGFGSVTRPTAAVVLARLRPLRHYIFLTEPMVTGELQPQLARLPLRRLRNVFADAGDRYRVSADRNLGAGLCGDRHSDSGAILHQIGETQRHAA